MHTPALRRTACINFHFTLTMELIKPFWTIYNMFDKMKNNNEQCPHVMQRLKALEKLALSILQKEPNQLSDDVKEALEKLNKVLLTAAELIGKFTQTFKVTQIVKSSDYKLEFDSLNKSLTDAFVTLSAALHVHQGKKLDEQEEKLLKQDEKLLEQESMLIEQQKKLAAQERKLAEQERKLAVQEDRLEEQEDILQRVESKLVYQSRGYYCILQ
ncbi:golgin subfamily A member 6-like protein 10 isoform X1 [Dicentrarchus labrax]|uniref:golgin subfamily A member 6-like protein 10 isoform X1 n=1 Tax=Dicentrarchus labrax TaxID=13489 RepID=UPI0021F60A8E|nr:golgin subfamily A member 6-like protein 10 isoform X1 [Dicentrarchus labrax]